MSRKGPGSAGADMCPDVRVEFKVTGDMGGEGTDLRKGQAGLAVG